MGRMNLPFSGFEDNKPHLENRKDRLNKLQDIKGSSGSVKIIPHGEKCGSKDGELPYHGHDRIDFRLSQPMFVTACGRMPVG